jgi:hypothetical protein
VNADRSMHEHRLRSGRGQTWQGIGPRAAPIGIGFPGA